MAAQMDWYDHSWKLLAGGLNLSTAELRIRLVTSGYTFSAAHTQWDNGANDATDPSYSELTTTGGYTVGGKQLTMPTLTNIKFDADDLVWTSLTATFRHAICVAIGTFQGVTNPVLFRLLTNSDNTDVVASGSNWTIAWNSTDGIIYNPDA